MKLKKIHELFIAEGMKADLRTPKQIQAHLRRTRQEYNKTTGSFKKFFDKESLTNPYSDARILYGNPEKEVRRILVGIDLEIGEVLMADQLEQRGEGFDLLLAHHPEGIALAGLHDVMHLQTDVLKNLGIEEKVARDFMNQRIAEVTRGVHGINHTRTQDAARLLDIPLMCCHTPADNHVSRYLQKLMNTQKPRTLKQIVDLLMKEPEYRDAVREKAGPRILAGKANDAAGKIFVDMTGGTSGSKELFARLSQLGITTQLGMHMSEAHYKKIKAEHMNVVIAGHMASDNLGMNLLLDKLEKKGKFEIVACSGFRRFKR